MVHSGVKQGFVFLSFHQRAGYSVEELFQLARSTNVQQRVLALTALDHIIEKVCRYSVCECVCVCVCVCVRESECVCVCVCVCV